MKQKTFTFAGITGFGRTITEAKENCEAKLTHLLQPTEVIALSPVYIIKPYSMEEVSTIAMFEYWRRLPCGKFEAGSLLSKRPDESDRAWMLKRLKEIQAEES